MQSHQQTISDDLGARLLMQQRWVVTVLHFAKYRCILITASFSCMHGLKFVDAHETSTSTKRAHSDTRLRHLVTSQVDGLAGNVEQVHLDVVMKGFDG